MSPHKDYGFIGINEILKGNLEVEWLVENFIPKKSVGMLFGASGSGKSHIAYSVALSIVNGSSWFGNDVTKGNVAVLVGEGNIGVNLRLKAIHKLHNIKLPDDNIAFSKHGIGLDTDKGFNTVKKSIDDLGFKPDLIIIDTLSRHIEESAENSNDDMAKFINRLDALKREYDCSVLLVHHTGKSGNSARGASALRANIDYSFYVEPNGKKQCKFICNKMKDADDDIPEKVFDIVTVNVGTNRKGKPITGACIAEASVINTPSGNKQDEYLQLALDAFKPDKSEWQKSYLSVDSDNVQDDTKKKRFRDSVKSLEASNQVTCGDDGKYQLVS